MAEQNRFNERYKTGDTPWELDRPDANLVRVVKEWPVAPCKALDAGCGTADNAIWLAQQGFDVTGADYSPLAIERAKAKAGKISLVPGKEHLKISFYVNDFLNQQVGTEEFEFLFDRGCFHTFDSPDDRSKFAQNAGIHLKTGGIWLSLIGNADAPEREEGPPVRSAKDIVEAVEPYFEILSLASGRFDSKRKDPSRNWVCIFKKRK